MQQGGSGVCIFLCVDFWYPEDVSAPINVIFAHLPHPLSEINKDSVLVCLTYPVLLTSIIPEPSSVLGTVNVFIKYLDLWMSGWMNGWMDG